jgi:peptidoglycan/xylan/chitin deacetylase (PgdA/CDA1 family)
MMKSQPSKILVYHKVSGKDAHRHLPSANSYSQGFEGQMKFLYNQGYRCYSIADLLTRNQDASQAEKTFFLTFDDGYEDFYDTAFPILTRYGFTAAVFLVTDQVGEKSDWKDESGSKLLSWNQIRKLHKQGITFGSHTCHHVDLPTVDKRWVQEELDRSKTKIEQELNTSIDWLAYPYGKSNLEVQDLTKEVGYKGAFGSATGKMNPFNYWRISCSIEESEFSFRYKLSPYFQFMKRLRRWVREDTPAGPYLRIVKRLLVRDR